MQENNSEQAQSTVAEQSAALYKSENDAREQVTRAAEVYTAATEGPESDLVSETYDEEDPEEAEAQLDSAGANLDTAVKRSNDFGAEHADELHEAAVKEAAQRVADVYEETEKPNGA